MIRKRRNGIATHGRLLDAATRLLREEGPQALTTGRLAEAAGIGQSSFYTHFKSTDELLVVAAEQIGQHLRGVALAWQQEITALSGGNIKQLAAHYERLLRLLLENRNFTELFLQYRRIPTPLGQALYGFERGVLEDVAAELAKIMHPTTPRPTALDRRLAEMILGIFWAAVDFLLRHPSNPNIRASALQLSVLTKTCVVVGYGDPAKLPVLDAAMVAMLESAPTLAPQSVNL